jgi:hypothetical protein
MRKAVLIPLLALATAASASAAAQERPDRPYQARPTRLCLISHGAQHLTTAKEPYLDYNKFGFGEPYDALVWNPGGPAGLDPITRRPLDWIGIEFTPNTALGRASERWVRHYLHAYIGYGTAWIRRHLIRRANVVVVAYSTNRPLTAGQRALIVGCLRPK